MTDDDPRINPTTYIRRKALELHMHPTEAKTAYHLGYLIILRNTGDASWGEVWSDEPLEKTDNAYQAMAVDLAAKLPDPDTIISMGFTYSLLDSVFLYRISPEFAVGEVMRLKFNQPADWIQLPMIDNFAKVLWEVLR